MLRQNTFNFLLRKETVWFARGLYSIKEFPAAITYFRQHSLDIPREFIVWEEDFHTLVLDLSRDLDLLYGDIARGSRRDIQYAESKGIRVSSFRDLEEGVNNFVGRHKRFNKAKGLGKPISRNAIIALRGNWIIYNAMLGDKWVSQVIFVYDQERMRGWVNGSSFDAELRKLRGYANKAMLWQAICDAKQMGLKLFDFGGIVLDKEDPRYGITLYKQYFGGLPLTERDSLVITNPLIRNLFQRLRKHK